MTWRSGSSGPVEWELSLRDWRIELQECAEQRLSGTIPILYSFGRKDGVSGV